MSSIGKADLVHFARTWVADDVEVRPWMPSAGCPGGHRDHGPETATAPKVIVVPTRSNQVPPGPPVTTDDREPHARPARKGR